MKSNKPLLILLIIFLSANSYLTFSKLNRLENRIANLNHSVFRLEDQIDRISGDVSRSLQTFKEENSWTRKAHAEAIGYQEADKSATVKVEVEFNELKTIEMVYLAIQDEEGNPVDKIDVTPALNETLSLDYSLKLPIDHDYALSIIGESGDSKRSIDLGDILLKSRIRKFMIVDSYGWQVEYTETGAYQTVGIDIIIHSFLEKDPFMADYFENRPIVDLYGEVYVDDLLFDTIDFFQEEDWTFSGIETEGFEESTPSSQSKSQVLPLFEFGKQLRDDLNISGLYTFKEPVPTSQKTNFFLILKDKQGDTYRFPLAYIFS